jgi:hypothetical protein
MQLRTIGAHIGFNIILIIIIAILFILASNEIESLYKSGDSTFKFPVAEDTNFDSVKFGNGNATALDIGSSVFPFTNNVDATARNSIEIETNWVSENSTRFQGSIIYIVPAITNQKILPDLLISTQYISNSIFVAASPGEIEPASFVIYSKQGVKSLMVYATDLKGSGDIIPSENLDIRVVKCWYQAGVGITDTTHKILTPELLLKDDNLVQVIGKNNYIKLINDTLIKISSPSGISGIPHEPTILEFPIRDKDTLQPVNIAEGTNMQFWLSIRIPEKTQPGLYNGTIILKTPTEQLGEIKLKVRVLPINLSKPYLNYSIYYLGILKNNGTISCCDKNEEQFRSEMKDLLDHGVTNPTIDLQDSLEDVLRIRNEVGLNNRAIYYLGLQINYYDGDLEKLKSRLTDLMNIVEPYGISEVYIYAPDEQSLNDTLNRAQINAVHEIGGKVFDAQVKSNASTVADVLDLAVAGKDPDILLADKYHDYGHKIFSYDNPQVGVEEPETYRRNYGLLLWQRDYDGAMDFAYQYEFGNIWNDFDYPGYRDHVFAYPTMNGVIDTIQWEGWREGVDDVRYLTTLLKTIERAKAEGKNTTNAENWLANLKDSNLERQDLNNIRATIIDYILSLSPFQDSNITKFGLKEDIQPSPTDIHFVP